MAGAFRVGGRPTGSVADGGSVAGGWRLAPAGSSPEPSSAAAGIPEYWVVDVDERAIDVFALAEGRYRRPRHYDAAATVIPGMAADAAVRVADVTGVAAG